MNIKKITGTLLAAAMLSGSGIALAKTVSKKAASALQTEQGWILEDTNNPTSPSSYALHSGTPADLNNVCEQEEEVCGIAAPADPSNPSQPQIDASLATEIMQGQTTDRVFLGPQSN